MKVSKKILCSTLALLMVVVAFVGCEKRDETSEPSSSTSSSSSSVEPKVDENTVESITPDFKHFIEERFDDNNDTIGWLQVPKTGVEDVVLWKEDPKNSFYLRKDFHKNYDFNGVYFIDGTTKVAKTDETTFDGSRESLPTNLVIYGHAMTDNAEKTTAYEVKMGPLHNLRDPEFAEEVPYVFYGTKEETFAYEVFALLVANVNDPELPYNNPSLSSEDYQKLIEERILDQSILNYEDVKLEKDDKFIVLSTCIYRLPGEEDQPEMPYPNAYRYAVIGRLVDKNAPLKETAKVSVNNKALEAIKASAK